LSGNENRNAKCVPKLSPTPPRPTLRKHITAKSPQVLSKGEYHRTKAVSYSSPLQQIVAYKFVL